MRYKKIKYTRKELRSVLLIYFKRLRVRLQFSSGKLHKKKSLLWRFGYARYYRDVKVFGRTQLWRFTIFKMYKVRYSRHSKKYSLFWIPIRISHRRALNNCFNFMTWNATGYEEIFSNLYSLNIFEAFFWLFFIIFTLFVTFFFLFLFNRILLDFFDYFSKPFVNPTVDFRKDFYIVNLLFSFFNFVFVVLFYLLNCILDFRLFISYLEKYPTARFYFFLLNKIKDSGFSFSYTFGRHFKTIHYFYRDMFLRLFRYPDFKRHEFIPFGDLPIFDLFVGLRIFSYRFYWILYLQTIYLTSLRFSIYVIIFFNYILKFLWIYFLRFKHFFVHFFMKFPFFIIEPFYFFITYHFRLYLFLWYWNGWLYGLKMKLLRVYYYYIQYYAMYFNFPWPHYADETLTWLSLQITDNERGVFIFRLVYSLNILNIFFGKSKYLFGWKKNYCEIIKDYSFIRIILFIFFFIWVNCFCLLYEIICFIFSFFMFRYLFLCLRYFGLLLFKFIDLIVFVRNSYTFFFVYLSLFFHILNRFLSCIFNNLEYFIFFLFSSIYYIIRYVIFELIFIIFSTIISLISKVLSAIWFLRRFFFYFSLLLLFLLLNLKIFFGLSIIFDVNVTKYVLEVTTSHTYLYFLVDCLDYIYSFLAPYIGGVVYFLFKLTKLSVFSAIFFFEFLWDFYFNIGNYLDKISYITSSNFFILWIKFNWLFWMVIFQVSQIFSKIISDYLVFFFFFKFDYDLGSLLLPYVYSIMYVYLFFFLKAFYAVDLYFYFMLRILSNLLLFFLVFWEKYFYYFLVIWSWLLILVGLMRPLLYIFDSVSSLINAIIIFIDNIYIAFIQIVKIVAKEFYILFINVINFCYIKMINPIIYVNDVFNFTNSFFYVHSLIGKSIVYSTFYFFNLFDVYWSPVNFYLFADFWVFFFKCIIYAYDFFISWLTIILYSIIPSIIEFIKSIVFFFYRAILNFILKLYFISTFYISLVTKYLIIIFAIFSFYYYGFIFFLLISVCVIFYFLLDFSFNNLFNNLIIFYEFITYPIYLLSFFLTFKVVFYDFKSLFYFSLKNYDFWAFYECLVYSLFTFLKNKQFTWGLFSWIIHSYYNKFGVFSLYDQLFQYLAFTFDLLHVSSYKMPNTSIDYFKYGVENKWSYFKNFSRIQDQFIFDPERKPTSWRWLRLWWARWFLEGYPTDELNSLKDDHVIDSSNHEVNVFPFNTAYWRYNRKKVSISCKFYSTKYFNYKHYFVDEWEMPYRITLLKLRFENELKIKMHETWGASKRFTMGANHALWKLTLLRNLVPNWSFFKGISYDNRDWAPDLHYKEGAGLWYHAFNFHKRWLPIEKKNSFGFTPVNYHHWFDVFFISCIASIFVYSFKNSRSVFFPKYYYRYKSQYSWERWRTKDHGLLWVYMWTGHFDTTLLYEVESWKYTLGRKRMVNSIYHPNSLFARAKKLKLIDGRSFRALVKDPKFNNFVNSLEGSLMELNSFFIGFMRFAKVTDPFLNSAIEHIEQKPWVKLFFDPIEMEWTGDDFMHEDYDFEFEDSPTLFSEMFDAFPYDLKGRYSMYQKLFSFFWEIDKHFNYKLPDVIIHKDIYSGDETRLNSGLHQDILNDSNSFFIGFYWLFLFPYVLHMFYIHDVAYMHQRIMFREVLYIMTSILRNDYFDFFIWILCTDFYDMSKESMGGLGVSMNRYHYDLNELGKQISPFYHNYYKHLFVGNFHKSSHTFMYFGYFNLNSFYSKNTNFFVSFVMALFLLLNIIFFNRNLKLFKFKSDSRIIHINRLVQYNKYRKIKHNRILWF